MSIKQVNIELVVLNYVRNQYENKYNRINVPVPLKYLITSFVKHIIGSTLLTLKEDIDFVQLLMTRIPNMKKFDLLFRASQHGFKATDFHNKCDNNKGATITIIKSNFGNIFGGYTTVPWASIGRCHNDKNAFVFLIRSSDESEQKECPLLFDIKKESEQYRLSDKMAVSHHKRSGPAFGRSDIFINNNCNDNATNCCNISSGTRQHTYNYNQFKGSLCGGSLKDKEDDSFYCFQVLEYEVYCLGKPVSY